MFIYLFLYYFVPLLLRFFSFPSLAAFVLVFDVPFLFFVFFVSLILFFFKIFVLICLYFPTFLFRQRAFSFGSPRVHMPIQRPCLCPSGINSCATVNQSIEVGVPRTNPLLLWALELQEQCWHTPLCMSSVLCCTGHYSTTVDRLDLSVLCSTLQTGSFFLFLWFLSSAVTYKRRRYGCRPSSLYTGLTCLCIWLTIDAAYNGEGDWPDRSSAVCLIRLLLIGRLIAWSLDGLIGYARVGYSSIDWLLGRLNGW